MCLCVCACVLYFLYTYLYIHAARRTLSLGSPKSVESNQGRSKFQTGLNIKPFEDQTVETRSKFGSK